MSRAAPRRSGRLSRWAFPPAVLLGYLVATLIVTFPLGFQIGRVIPGKEIDGWENVWNVWWAKEALLDLHTTPYFTRSLYHPEGVSLYFHALGLGAAPLSVPLQLVLDPPAAMLATLLLLTALAGFNAYWLVYYVVPNRLAAFAGGLIFAANPYQVYHLSFGQINLTAITWIPLFALCLLRALRERRPWLVGAAGVLLLLVSLSDWQYAFYCFLFAGCLALWELGRAGDRRARARILAAGLGVAAVYAALVAPIAIGMIREFAANPFARRPAWQVLLRSLDGVTLLLPNPFHPLWGGLARPIYDRIYGPDIYSGIAAVSYVAVALALVALVRRWRAGGFWLAMFALYVALALGPQLQVNGASVGAPMPYRLYGALPFVNISRSPCVFLKFAFLMLAVPAALGLDVVMRSLAAGKGRGLALGAGALLTAAIGFEYLSAPVAAAPVDPAPSFYARLAATPAAGYGILDVPTAERDFPMYDQTAHGWPIVGGNLSRDNPHPLLDHLPPIAALDSDRYPLADRDIFAPTDLAAIGEAGLAAQRIRYVVVHEERLSDKERARVARSLARIFPGRAPIFAGAGLAVYEVRPPRQVALVALDERWFGPDKLPQGGEPYRWIGERAGAHIYAPGAATATLRFTAHNFARSYTLRVLVNGVPAGSHTIAAGFTEIQAPVALREGDNLVEFAIVEPPRSAADLGLGEDTRRVSVGISRLRIEPARP